MALAPHDRTATDQTPKVTKPLVTREPSIHALAGRMARTVWALLKTGENYRVMPG